MPGGGLDVDRALWERTSESRPPNATCPFERIIGSLPLGVRGDIRAGLALEAGRRGDVLTGPGRKGWLNSLALYLGGEMPFGPVYLGIGHSTAGATNAYLSIGAP